MINLERIEKEYLNWKEKFEFNYENRDIQAFNQFIKTVISDYCSNDLSRENKIEISCLVLSFYKLLLKLESNYLPANSSFEYEELFLNFNERENFLEDIKSTYKNIFDKDPKQFEKYFESLEYLIMLYHSAEQNYEEAILVNEEFIEAKQIVFGIRSVELISVYELLGYSYEQKYKYGDNDDLEYKKIFKSWINSYEKALSIIEAKPELLEKNIEILESLLFACSTYLESLDNESEYYYLYETYLHKVILAKLKDFEKYKNELDEIIELMEFYDGLNRMDLITNFPIRHTKDLLQKNVSKIIKDLEELIEKREINFKKLKKLLKLDIHDNKIKLEIYQIIYSELGFDNNLIAEEKENVLLKPNRILFDLNNKERKLLEKLIAEKLIEIYSSELESQSNSIKYLEKLAEQYKLIGNIDLYKETKKKSQDLFTIQINSLIDEAKSSPNSLEKIKAYLQLNEWDKKNNKIIRELILLFSNLESQTYSIEIYNLLEEFQRENGLKFWLSLAKKHFQSIVNDQELEAFLIKVIDITATLIKGDHNNRKLIDSLDNLTRFYDELTTFYKKQGNYELVEDYLKKKISIRQKILGEFNEKVATAINNLAYFYADQEKNELAEKHFYEALRIYEDLTLIKGDNFKHYKLSIIKKIQDLKKS